MTSLKASAAALPDPHTIAISHGPIAAETIAMD
nr:MAG TPA: hypothetical protein [Caudoviricetes sp.]